MTRGGVYDEILPEPEGFPEGSVNISLYTPPLVTIQLHSSQVGPAALKELVPSQYCEKSSQNHQNKSFS